MKGGYSPMTVRSLMVCRALVHPVQVNAVWTPVGTGIHGPANVQRRLHAGVRQCLSLCDDLCENNPPLFKISPLILGHHLEISPHKQVESKGWQAFFTDFLGE